MVQGQVGLMGLSDQLSKPLDADTNLDLPMDYSPSDFSGFVGAGSMKQHGALTGVDS